MPVTMYQSFTFFNLTNWNQVKSIGQKPRFVEVGPYVYKTIWTKSDINFIEDDTQVTFAEKKQWIFQTHLSNGFEDDQIWTINTPLMTALALIQNAPVITRNIVSVILDGLGEGAFIKRSIRGLLFEGYSDLIVSVGPLFDRRFANFNGKFAYLYNKNDSVDGVWTVSTGTDDISMLNKILKFQSNIVNMTAFSSGQQPQGLNEVKAECASAWSLDQATNGQLFAPFTMANQPKNSQHQHNDQAAGGTQNQHQPQPQSPTPNPTQANNNHQRSRARADLARTDPLSLPARRFFSRSGAHENHNHHSSPNQQHQQQQQQDLVPNPFTSLNNERQTQSIHDKGQPLKDMTKYIFYPDLCRPIHLIPSKEEIVSANGIKAYRYYIDSRTFMNSSQVPSNRCYEMNPRAPLANALAATINSVTGANVAMPNLVTGASSPFAMFSPASSHHSSNTADNGGNIFERANHPTSFLNHALHSLGAVPSPQNAPDHANGNGPLARLGRVRQLLTNIVSQRMTASGPGSLLPSLTAGPASMLMGNHLGGSSTSRNSMDDSSMHAGGLLRSKQASPPIEARQSNGNGDILRAGASQPVPVQSSNPPPAPIASDRWITQFRFKWPRGVFSIGQCQLGAPIYASLPHFLDADEYYLEQVDGLKPNRSLHEFYIDMESSLHSIPVNAKARLQLNVATPELRFRNIPNAMIPVLWQEVSFEMDKPVASMLYWSFTMSSTLYKLVAVLLIGFALALMTVSLVGGLRLRKRNRVDNDDSQSNHSNNSSNSNHNNHNNNRNNRNTHRDSSNKKRRPSSRSATNEPTHRLEGHRSSWQPHMMQPNMVRTMDKPCKMGHNLGRTMSYSGSSSDTLSDMRTNGNLNRAFVACQGDINDVHLGDDHVRACEYRTGSTHNNLLLAAAAGHHCCANSAANIINNSANQLDSQSGPVSGGSINATNSSPKQPSSRASSNCELVSSMGNNGTLNCTGCLLACLRHLPNSVAAHGHSESMRTVEARGRTTTASDNGSIVRDNIISIDINKATL